VLNDKGELVGINFDSTIEGQRSNTASSGSAST
jgi:hypothetical protein